MRIIASRLSHRKSITKQAPLNWRASRLSNRTSFTKEAPLILRASRYSHRTSNSKQAQTCPVIRIQNRIHKAGTRELNSYLLPTTRSMRRRLGVGPGYCHQYWWESVVSLSFKRRSMRLRLGASPVDANTAGGRRPSGKLWWRTWNPSGEAMLFDETYLFGLCLLRK